MPELADHRRGRDTDPVDIDAIGVGWGVAGRVAEVCRNNGWDDVEVNALKVSESSSKPDEYKRTCEQSCGGQHAKRVTTTSGL
jgi:hypothetical protein